jgi:hypothetical protein
MLFRLLPLLAACSDFSTHVPDITAPCSRAVVAEVISQPDKCVRLDDAGGALFRRADSEDCGGPDCARVCDGDALPFCAHSALCEEQPERCE